LSPKGFTSQLEERKSFASSKDILKFFVDDHNKMGDKLLDVEKEFSMDIAGIDIKGRIDKIDKDKDDL
jgi:RecB family exonuclease